MRFDADADDKAFEARRDELGEQFAAWLSAQKVPGDPHDAGMLMDWKRGYADGVLDVWTVEDVSEFLFDWCVRKLSASPQDSAEIPVSVAAFVEFLAHTGLLGAGSDLPSQIRRYCEANANRFVREMGNPANFGMAKSMFGGGPGVTADPLDALERLGDLPQRSIGALLADLADDDEAPVFGPVRLPTDEERALAVREVPVLRRLRLLAQQCPPPGRALTAKGNLRLADARQLVETLDTGDDTARIRSAEELPELGWIVELGASAGVVRRHRGKLVAVAAFAARDDVAGYDAVLRAAVRDGLTGPHLPLVAPVWARADECVVALFAALLGTDEVEVTDLAAFMAELLDASFAGMPAILLTLVPGLVGLQLERLAELGAIELTMRECTDCGEAHEIEGTAALTPAAVAVAVELVREAGLEIAVRPDPAVADAAAVVDVIGTVAEATWQADISAWFAAQPDPAVASAELVAAMTAEHRVPLLVVAGTGLLDDVAGEHAVPAMRAQVGGPHDGLVLHWLIGRSAIDPAGIDPIRFVVGLIDILAVALDAVGPQECTALFAENDPAEQLQLLDNIWRLDHPRLPELLDAVGAHHRVKAVAKAARRASMKLRSRRAEATRADSIR